MRLPTRSFILGCKQKKVSTNLPCYAIPTTLVSRPTELDLATTTYLSTYFIAIKFDRDWHIRPAQNRVFPGKFDFSLGAVLFSLQMV